MNIKTGSEEEIKAEERLEKLRIASAERKWKMELKNDAARLCRETWLNYLHTNDWMTGVVSLCMLGITIAAICCICHLVWRF